MKYLKIHCLLLFLLLPFAGWGQEFNCEVTINDQQLEGNSFEYVSNSLKSELEAYINNYRWTEVEFREMERIDCQMNIILVAGDSDFNFSAEVVIQARRPIYNTTSETATIIISDQAWQFNYPEGKSLLHDDLQFEALTGFIDFYCYLMLGYDFDSFSELGGTNYFLKAQNVVDLAQNTSALGWSRSSNNRRNRFVLIADLLSSNYEPLRKAYYAYHRLVLDDFVTNPDEARSLLIDALTTIQEAKRRSTNNYVYDLFFDTKSKEITSMLIDAELGLKLEAYNILRETDSGHLTEYEVLQN